MQLRYLSAWFLCLAAAAAAAAAAPAEVPIGGTVDDALLQGLNGPSRPLSAFRGRPLLINLWASWCGPCREEMASLERLAWGGGHQDLVIIGISTDDDADRAKHLLRSSHATISQFIDTHLQMENMLGATRLPLTVLIDAKGRIVQKVYGAKAWDGADMLRLIDDAFRPTSR